jgi:hypothetical protein
MFDSLKEKLSKAVLLHHADAKGERIRSSLTLALDGVSGQRHAPAALYPRERTNGTHWLGGWVCLRAGLDKKWLEEKSFTSSGDRNLLIQSVLSHHTD